MNIHTLISIDSVLIEFLYESDDNDRRVLMMKWTEYSRAAMRGGSIHRKIAE